MIHTRNFLYATIFFSCFRANTERFQARIGCVIVLFLLSRQGVDSWQKKSALWYNHNGILFSCSFVYCLYLHLFTQILNVCDSNVFVFCEYFWCRLLFNKQNWHHNKTTIFRETKRNREWNRGREKERWKEQCGAEKNRSMFLRVIVENLFAKKLKLNNSKSSI